MNATERKPNEEVLEALDGATTVFILGCKGCPVGCDTGGEPWVAEMTTVLGDDGKTVIGHMLVDMLCNKAGVSIRLGRHRDALSQADAILVGSCGVGVQSVSNMVGRLAVPAFNTICMGDYQGLWPSAERCAECGDCMLARTGGLCPITLCSKSLVNGICGGTGDDGTCEVTPDMPCGWRLIYERLEALGRLDDYQQMQVPKDFRKRQISDAYRKTVRWALEQSEQDEAEAEAAGKA